MTTLLICHDGARLDRIGIARWLASFSTLGGVIILRETKQRIWRRVRREIKRIGFLRFSDVLAFRFYYKVFLSKNDLAWQERKLTELCSVYPEVDREVPTLYTHSPNTPEAEQFIRLVSPDIVLARCKALLSEKIFTLPSRGTFVMHPGICPEYRNAHGCFWALAEDDLDKVGMTLLQIDKGVDTGAVYGYYKCTYDEVNESHIVIQHKVVLENLREVQKTLVEIYDRVAVPLNTRGRSSVTWGQPWLSSYRTWKHKARKRKVKA